MYLPLIFLFITATMGELISINIKTTILPNKKNMISIMSDLLDKESYNQFSVYISCSRKVIDIKAALSVKGLCGFEMVQEPMTLLESTLNNLSIDTHTIELSKKDDLTISYDFTFYTKAMKMVHIVYEQQLDLVNQIPTKRLVDYIKLKDEEQTFSYNLLEVENSYLKLSSMDNLKIVSKNKLNSFNLEKKDNKIYITGNVSKQRFKELNLNLKLLDKKINQVSEEYQFYIWNNNFVRTDEGFYADLFFVIFIFYTLFMLYFLLYLLLKFLDYFIVEFRKEVEEEDCKRNSVVNKLSKSEDIELNKQDDISLNESVNTEEFCSGKAAYEESHESTKNDWSFMIESDQIDTLDTES